MNKELIKKMIKEKRQMIEVLQSHIQQLQDIIGEKVEDVATPFFTNNISQQIEAYRKKIMADLELNIPTASSSAFGGVMPNQFKSMESKFEQMKKELEGNIKG